MVSQKKQRQILAIVLSVFLFFVAFSVLMDIGVGGTGWQFQFSGQACRVNGVFAPSVRNPIYFDVDGAGAADGFTTIGALPGIAVSYDVPGRCTSKGEPLVWNAPPTKEDQYEVQVNSTFKDLYTLYYYSFGYVLSTAAKAYTDGYLVRFTNYEAGSVDVELTFTVDLQRSIFSNITGYLMDCRILSQSSNLDGYDLGALSWAIMPAVNPIQEKGALVSILNAQKTPDHYTCALYTHSILTGGRTTLSFGSASVGKFDVVLQRKLMLTLLLKQPLKVGAGSTQTTTEPPRPIIPLDLLTLILLIVALIIICLVIISVLRILPIILGGRRR